MQVIFISSDNEKQMPEKHYPRKHILHALKTSNKD